MFSKGVLTALLLLGCSLSLKSQEETLGNWSTQQGMHIQLPKLIELISGHTVYNWDETQAPVFQQVARSVIQAVHKEPIRARRINEVGNAVELLVLDALEKAGMDSGRPVPPSGRRKTAGYPDLFAETGKEYFYIEIKTYSPRTVNSSQRTFYISPSDDFKVARDGYHLLLAFSTEQLDEGTYSLTGFKLLDLYELECQLKLEFNASNKDLYGDEPGLVVVEE